MANAASTQVGERYMLDRSSRESARLHVQHWMWGQCWGFQLHPQIPRSENMSVVDLGAGNACWLLETARTLPSQTRLVGLDVSSSQFPAKELLPENVQLRTADVFADLPEDLLGQFDVVHLRAFGVIIKGGDPTPLLKNIVKLLRPNGYLQWDDFDCGTFTAHAPNSFTSAANTAELLSQWQKFAAKTDLTFSWTSSLRQTFEASGLDVLQNERRATPRDLYKPSTDDFAMALYDIGLISASRDPDLLGTAEEWRALFERMMIEIQSGVSIALDMVFCLGRKASSVD